MSAFVTPGKVVILLAGRYAGRKAVIVKAYISGNGARKYPHAIVAGIDKYPLKVTKSMSRKKVAKRCRVTPFVKIINLNHMMPTRYNFALDLKDVVTPEAVSGTADTRTKKVTAKKALKSRFEQKYKTGENRWFFTKLRF